MIKRLFKDLYGKDIRIEKAYDSENYVLRTKHKPACLNLLNITKFGTHEWRVPFSLLSSKKLQSFWLKAFFTAEGSVHLKGKYIQLQSVNKIGIEDVQNLLKNFNIKSRIYTYQRKNPNWNTNYILQINRKNTIIFNKYIGFYSIEKQQKLDNACRSG